MGTTLVIVVALCAAWTALVTLAWLIVRGAGAGDRMEEGRASRLAGWPVEHERRRHPRRRAADRARTMARIAARRDGAKAEA